MAAAKAGSSGIKSLKLHGPSEVKSLQELHSEIKDKE
jgi:carbamoyl-phosphate synthase large subunit